MLLEFLNLLDEQGDGLCVARTRVLRPAQAGEDGKYNQNQIDPKPAEFSHRTFLLMALATKQTHQHLPRVDFRQDGLKASRYVGMGAVRYCQTAEANRNGIPFRQFLAEVLASIERSTAALISSFDPQL
jgi:hypothetical protein